MQDAHLVGAELDGIIDEVGDGLDGLVGAHATHINVRFKLKLARADFV